MKTLLSVLFLVNSAMAETDFFDTRYLRLKQAIVRQKSNGYTQPISHTLAQKLNLNLKRWRHDAELNSPTFVLVDVARFVIEFYYQNRLVLYSRALVGQRQTPTPIFDSTIEAIAFNPEWQIPDSIAVHEILPIIKDDPEALVLAGFKAFQKTDGRRIEITDNRLSRLETGVLPFGYILKEAPNPQNPLGDLKFVSKNPFSILIHGTYEKSLFEATNRAVSHGCVRIEHSLELAIKILRVAGINADRNYVDRVLATNKEFEIRLPKKIPVYYRYWTAWADENLSIHYEKDIYGLDR